MKVQSRFAVSIAALLLTAITAWANITTDYDHHVDFAHYKTYSFGKILTGDGLWDDRVKDAVAGQMAAKGLTQVASGGDVVVCARGVMLSLPQLNTFYDGFRGWGGFGWPGGGSGMATTTMSFNEMGTLVIDMFDAHTKKQIWRGTASGTLSDKPEKVIKKLDDAVQKMFKNFPPEPKK
jgi:NADPH:quinone reductase-like Zn-dependent oxidoreductase